MRKGWALIAVFRMRVLRLAHRCKLFMLLAVFPFFIESVVAQTFQVTSNSPTTSLQVGSVKHERIQQKLVLHSIVHAVLERQDTMLQHRLQSMQEIEDSLIQNVTKIRVATLEVEQVAPNRLMPTQVQIMGFFDERPLQDEVIMLPTAAGPVRVPYGYLLGQPSRKFLATGDYRFHFGFWMPSGRMPGVDTSGFTLMPSEAPANSSSRNEHFVSLGPIVIPGAIRSNDLDVGLAPEQRLRNTFSTFGRDNFTYEIGPRMTRAIPKPGTSAFDIYYHTDDGAGNSLPFLMLCPSQDWARAEVICDGRVLFRSIGVLSAVRVKIEAVHLLPDALDVAVQLLMSWLSQK